MCVPFGVFFRLSLLGFGAAGGWLSSRTGLRLEAAVVLSVWVVSGVGVSRLWLRVAMVIVVAKKEWFRNIRGLKQQKMVVMGDVRCLGPVTFFLPLFFAASAACARATLDAFDVSLLMIEEAALFAAGSPERVFLGAGGSGAGRSLAIGPSVGLVVGRGEWMLSSTPPEVASASRILPGEVGLAGEVDRWREGVLTMSE